MTVIIKRNPIQTTINTTHELTHCNNCHNSLKPKAWRGKNIGLCYKCFKRWERFELKEQARKDNDPRHQRLSELVGKLTFLGLTKEEKSEYDLLLDELSKEDNNIATLKLFVDIVKVEAGSQPTKDKG